MVQQHLSCRLVHISYSEFEWLRGFDGESPTHAQQKNKHSDSGCQHMETAYWHVSNRMSCEVVSQIDKTANLRHCGNQLANQRTPHTRQARNAIERSCIALYCWYIRMWSNARRHLYLLILRGFVYEKKNMCHFDEITRERNTFANSCVYFFDHVHVDQKWCFLF